MRSKPSVAVHVFWRTNNRRRLIRASAEQERCWHVSTITLDQTSSFWARRSPAEVRIFRPLLRIPGLSSFVVYPVSAVLADKDIMLCIQPGEHGSTYGG